MAVPVTRYRTMSLTEQLDAARRALRSKEEEHLRLSVTGERPDIVEALSQELEADGARLDLLERQLHNAALEELPTISELESQLPSESDEAA